MGLFVAYYPRAIPRFATVKELLDSGRIGPVGQHPQRAARVGHAADRPRKAAVQRVNGGGLEGDWFICARVSASRLSIVDLMDLIGWPRVGVSAGAAVGRDVL